MSALVGFGALSMPLPRATHAIGAYIESSHSLGRVVDVFKSFNKMAPPPASSPKAPSGAAVLAVTRPENLLGLARDRKSES